MAKQPKREPGARPQYPVLSVEQQLALGTGAYASMKCKYCGQLGCLTPVPHGAKSGQLTRDECAAFFEVPAALVGGNE